MQINSEPLKIFCEHQKLSIEQVIFTMYRRYIKWFNKKQIEFRMSEDNYTKDKFIEWCRNNPEE
jgi:hypothetical protein